MPVSVRSETLLALVACAALCGCRQEVALPPSHVELVAVGSLPSGPDDPAWQAAPEFTASMILQDLVDPRMTELSTSELRIRAVTDGTQVAFRLQWADPTRDDLIDSARFTDACAVQLPATIEPTLPAPQMGEEGHPVEITYWTAAWQAEVDGRARSLKQLYPNSTVDHYPFEAASLEPGSPTQQAMEVRYAPALAAGNPMAERRTTSVEQLVAAGPGTLTHAPDSSVTGRGERTADGWAVVILRPLPEGFASQPETHVAFAVWDGSNDEVGSRKMRTAWITMTQSELQAPGAGD
ncbi:MAG TPA: hypothetical protein EYH34_06320 [Planctomycetes bacterium]|nr:hypothetical protein [Planctomycetota bacterium]